MSVEINENHKIVTVEHELHYEGHFLSERKQMIIEDSDNDSELTLNFCCDGPENSNNERRITLVHLRQIDEKCYKVTKDFLNGHECFTKVDTEMTDENVKQFAEDWINFWNPEITKKMIENLHERIK